MSVLDKAISHFSKKEVRSIEVPEWECTVYARNLTLEDKAKWITRSDGDNVMYLVYALIFGAMDKDGESIFDIGDKVKLMRNVDPEVLARVSGFILASQEAEELEKN